MSNSAFGRLLAQRNRGGGGRQVVPGFQPTQLGDPNFSRASDPNTRAQFPAAAAESSFMSNRNAAGNRLQEAALLGYDTSGSQFDPIRQMASTGVISGKRTLGENLINAISGPMTFVNLILQDITGGAADSGFRNPNFFDYVDAIFGGIEDQEGFEAATGLRPNSVSHTLDLFGWEEADDDDWFGKAIRGVAHFGLEMAIDPLTYLTGGMSGLGRKVGVAAGKQVQADALQKIVPLAKQGLSGPQIADMMPNEYLRKVARTHQDDVAALAQRLTDPDSKGELLAKMSADQSGALKQMLGFEVVDEKIVMDSLHELAILQRVGDDVLRPLAGRSFKDLDPDVLELLPAYARGGLRLSVPFFQSTLAKGVMIPGTQGLGRKLFSEPTLKLSAKLREFSPNRYGKLADAMVKATGAFDQQMPLIRQFGRGELEPFEFHIMSAALDRASNVGVTRVAVAQMRNRWDEIKTLVEGDESWAGRDIGDLHAHIIDLVQDRKHLDSGVEGVMARVAGGDTSADAGVGRQVVLEAGSPLDVKVRELADYIRAQMDEQAALLKSLDPDLEFLDNFYPAMRNEHSGKVLELLAEAPNAGGVRISPGQDAAMDLLGRILAGHRRGGLAQYNAGGSGRVTSQEFSKAAMLNLNAASDMLMLDEATMRQFLDDLITSGRVNEGAVTTRHIPITVLNEMLEPAVRRLADDLGVALPKGWNGKLFNENPMESYVGFIEATQQAIDSWGMVNAMRAAGLAEGKSVRFDVQEMIQRMYDGVLRKADKVDNVKFGRPSKGVQQVPMSELEGLLDPKRVNEVVNPRRPIPTPEEVELRNLLHRDLDVLEDISKIEEFKPELYRISSGISDDPETDRRFLLEFFEDDPTRPDWLDMADSLEEGLEDMIDRYNALIDQAVDAGVISTAAGFWDFLRFSDPERGEALVRLSKQHLKRRGHIIERRIIDALGITADEFEQRWGQIRFSEGVDEALEEIRGELMNVQELRDFMGDVTVPSAQYAEVRDQIAKDGQINEPIIVGLADDGTPYIIDGHRRVMAAKELGLTEAPVQLRETAEAAYKTGKSWKGRIRVRPAKAQDRAAAPMVEQDVARGQTALKAIQDLVLGKLDTSQLRVHTNGGWDERLAANFNGLLDEAEIRGWETIDEFRAQLRFEDENTIPSLKQGSLEAILDDQLDAAYNDLEDILTDLFGGVEAFRQGPLKKLDAGMARLGGASRKGTIPNDVTPMPNPDAAVLDALEEIGAELEGMVGQPRPGRTGMSGEEVLGAVLDDPEQYAFHGTVAGRSIEKAGIIRKGGLFADRAEAEKWAKGQAAKTGQPGQVIIVKRDTLPSGYQKSLTQRGVVGVDSEVPVPGGMKVYASYAADHGLEAAAGRGVYNFEDKFATLPWQPTMVDKEPMIPGYKKLLNKRVGGPGHPVVKKLKQAGMLFARDDLHLNHELYELGTMSKLDWDSMRPAKTGGGAQTVQDVLPAAKPKPNEVGLSISVGDTGLPSISMVVRRTPKQQRIVKADREKLYGLLDDAFATGELSFTPQGIRSIVESPHVGDDVSDLIHDYVKLRIGNLDDETKEFITGEIAELVDARLLFQELEDVVNQVAKSYGHIHTRATNGNGRQVYPSIPSQAGDVGFEALWGRLREIGDKMTESGYGKISKILDASESVLEMVTHPGFVDPAKHGVLGPAVTGITMHKSMVDLLHRIGSSNMLLSTPQGVVAAKLAASETLHWWKAMATVARPMFHVRNLIGGSWMNMLMGVRRQDMADVALNVGRFRNALFNTAYPAGSNPIEEALKVLPEGRIREGFRAMVAEDVLNGFASTEIRRLPKHEKDSIWRLLNVADVDNFALTRAGGKIMESVEDYMRASLFMRYFDPANPASAKTAREVVNAVHFDYTNLTPMETKMKSLIPFFVWSRRNIPRQLEMMVENPRMVAKYRAMMNAMNENFGGSEDDSTLPAGDWFGSLAAGTSIYVNGETPFWGRVMIDPDLPINDLLELPMLEPSQMVEWASGMLGPHVSTLLNLNEQREFGDVNAPAPLVPVLKSLAAVGLYDESLNGDVRVPYFARTLTETALPFSRDVLEPLMGGGNDPNRRARFGITEDDGWAVGAGKNVLGQVMSALGVKLTTPADANSVAFRSNEELQRIVRELRFQGALPPSGQ